MRTLRLFAALASFATASAGHAQLTWTSVPPCMGADAAQTEFARDLEESGAVLRQACTVALQPTTNMHGAVLGYDADLRCYEMHARSDTHESVVHVHRELHSVDASCDALSQAVLEIALIHMLGRNEFNELTPDAAPADTPALSPSPSLRLGSPQTSSLARGPAAASALAQPVAPRSTTTTHVVPEHVVQANLALLVGLTPDVPVAFALGYMHDEGFLSWQASARAALFSRVGFLHLDVGELEAAWFPLALGNHMVRFHIGPELALGLYVPSYRHECGSVMVCASDLYVPADQSLQAFVRAGLANVATLFVAPWLTVRLELHLFTMLIAPRFMAAATDTLFYRPEPVGANLSLGFGIAL